jgi:hypothetical protein
LIVGLASRDKALMRECMLQKLFSLFLSAGESPSVIADFLRKESDGDINSKAYRKTDQSSLQDDKTFLICIFHNLPLYKFENLRRNGPSACWPACLGQVKPLVKSSPSACWSSQLGQLDGRRQNH